MLLYSIYNAMAATSISASSLFGGYRPGAPGGVLSAVFPVPTTGITPRARPFDMSRSGLGAAPGVAVDAYAELGAMETGEFEHHVFTGELPGKYVPLPHLPSVGEFAFFNESGDPELSLPQQLRRTTSRLAPLYNIAASNALLALQSQEPGFERALRSLNYADLAEAADEIARPWACAGVVKRYQLNNHELSATLKVKGNEQMASYFGPNWQAWDDDTQSIVELDMKSAFSEFSTAGSTIGFQLQVVTLYPGQAYQSTGGVTNTGETMGSTSFRSSMHEPPVAAATFSIPRRPGALAEPFNAFQWVPLELSRGTVDTFDYIRDNLSGIFPFIEVGRIVKSGPLFRPYVSSASFSNTDLLQANLHGRSHVRIETI
jgi:hypothetical protein